jgi:hypothetical protein
MTRWKVLSPFVLAVVILAAATPPRADANTARRTRAISGRILQVGTAAPIASVQVMIRGERIGSMTATNGRFDLPDVPDGPAELVLRHPCYFPVYIALPAAGDATIAIGLPFDESSLKRAGCGGLGARRPDTSHE